MVRIPIYRAVYHPTILPSFRIFCLQVTSFFAVYKSPQAKAQFKDDKNCYYPRLAVRYFIYALDNDYPRA
jgi:hypothetical protein